MVTLDKIFEQLIEIISENVADFSERKQVYHQLIDVAVEHDTDQEVFEDALDRDKAFDRAYKEYFADEFAENDTGDQDYNDQDE